MGGWVAEVRGEGWTGLLLAAQCAGSTSTHTEELERKHVFTTVLAHAQAFFFFNVTLLFYKYILKIIRKGEKKLIFIPHVYVFLGAEWTHISTRYLREQLAKISDFYHLASSSGDGPVPVPPDVEQAMKQWEYNEKLAFHMFQVTFPRHSWPCSIL